MSWMLLFVSVIALTNAVVAFYAVLNFRASKRNLDVARELRDAELQRVRRAA